METTICIPVRDSEATVHHTMGIVDQVLALPDDLALVVVDNASPCEATGNFLHAAAQRDRRLQVIANRHNLGVGPGYNQGMAWAAARGSRNFVCLNNDIVFGAPDWLGALTDPLRRNPRQLVGLRRIAHNRLVNRGGQVHAYLEGFCLALSAVFLDEVGYFDEWLAPAWVEDVELSWRAERHGYALCEVALPYDHATGRSSVQMPRDLLTFRNIERFLAKVREGRDRRLGWPQGEGDDDA